MTKRAALYTSFIVCFALAAFAANWISGTIVPAREALPPVLKSNRKVLLVPLDSRPPCTSFVADIGRIAGVEIMLPPSPLMDNYQQPADQYKLRQWLSDNFRQADAVIVATDMLIHGGLLASRHARGSDQDIADTLTLLRHIHEAAPEKPLYAFSIIPRLLLADSNEGKPWQKPLMNYSILHDQVRIFENPVDIKKLHNLELIIPPQFITRYQALYEQNLSVNKSLVDLVNQGVLARLVLGQDDGQPFGLPNQIKEKLSQYVLQSPAAEKIQITRGTDEVALTLLGHYANYVRQYTPQVYVAWSHPSVPPMVMPFMPHSVIRTVEEKLTIIGADAASSPQTADFILYVHAGSRQTGPRQLARAAMEIKELIAAGHQVAVVDLTENYFAQETLLPYCIQNGTDLTKLAAYAGWNTTSNSIGTALTQAAAWSGRQRELEPKDMFGLYGLQLAFLLERFLDDWYFQKSIQPAINAELRAVGANPYQLRTQYHRTAKRINRFLKNEADQLYRQVLADRRIHMGGDEYRIISLTVSSSIPWDRTFEIDLIAVPSYVQIQKK